MTQGSFLFRLDLPTDHGTPFRTSVEYQRVAKRTMESSFLATQGFGAESLWDSARSNVLQMMKMAI
jgi:hypothetical protein